MKIHYKNPQKENWYLISWTLSNKCNYRCTYCPTFLHDGTTGHPDWDTVKNFVENFDVGSKEVCFRISGGEPTYWKHFLDLAKLIKSKGHYFTFLTNGSQSVDYYKEISKYSDGIIISYHIEYAKIDHIVEVANAVSCPVVVNLMMVQDKFDQLINIAKELYNETTHLAVWPKVVLDKSDDKFTNNPAEYTVEQKKTIEDWPYFRPVDDSKIHRGAILLDNRTVTANDLIIEKLNYHKNWECWAGLHSLSIDMWGDIYRSECRQGGPIGNLKDYTLPTNTIICQAEKCSCLGDIYLMKESKNKN